MKPSVKWINEQEFHHRHDHTQGIISSFVCEYNAENKHVLDSKNQKKYIQV